VKAMMVRATELEYLIVADFGRVLSKGERKLPCRICGVFLMRVDWMMLMSS
jgi:hypothetical protein